MREKLIKILSLKYLTPTAKTNLVESTSFATKNNLPSGFFGLFRFFLEQFIINAVDHGLPACFDDIF